MNGSLPAMVDDDTEEDDRVLAGFMADELNEGKRLWDYPTAEEIARDAFHDNVLAPDLRRHSRLAPHWARILRQYPAALAVAVVLSAHATTERRVRKCWVKQQTIAEELGVTERAVRSAIATLKRVGFIVAEERRFQKSSRLFLRDYEPPERAE